MSDQHVRPGEPSPAPPPKEASSDARFSSGARSGSDEQLADDQARSQIQAESLTAQEEVPSSDHRIQPAQIVDWGEAQRLIPGGPEVLAELIEAVQVECVSLLADLEQAMARMDAKQLTRAAHTLKSSARYFGAQPVVDAAFKLEDMGRRGSLDGAETELEQLKPLVNLLLQDLARWKENPN